MNIQKLYDEYVAKIHQLDMKISELQGKRDAYNDVRLDLFNELEESQRVKPRSESEDKE